jgi:hypothetical protein
MGPSAHSQMMVLLKLDAERFAYGMLMAMRRCWRVTKGLSSACWYYLTEAFCPGRMTRLSGCGRAHGVSRRLLATMTLSGMFLQC